MLKVIEPFRFVLLFLVSVFFVQTLDAQTANARRDQIRNAVEGGDLATALVELQALRSTDTSAFTLNNYDYLLARLSEKRGDLATAATNYQAVVSRDSVLTQYALWHLAEIARALGNLQLEREHLRRLLATAPESLLYNAAQMRLGESFFESADYASVINTLRPKASATASASSRKALALIGQAYLLSNQPQAARDVFNSLVTTLPDAARPDDFALTAARGLDKLDGFNEQSAQTNSAQLPETEHLRRALIFNFNRDFEDARLHYQAIIRAYPQSANVPDALYQTGRTFYQERNYDQALAYFQRLMTQFPESTSARDALAQMAATYSRLKRTDDAVAAYRRFIERYPDAPNPERPFLNIIDVLRDARRDVEALNWAEQTRTRFRGKTPAALALFSQARIHLSQSNWTLALAYLVALGAETDLGGTRVPGGTIPTEVAFMRAYTLEQLGRIAEAVSAYLSIPDGRNEYYGGRATRRLRALRADARATAIINARFEAFRAEAAQAIANGQAETARRSAQTALRLTEDAARIAELLDIARRAYAALPDYNRLPTPRLIAETRTTPTRETSATVSHKTLADELLFLSLYDEGAPELAVAENAFGANANTVTMPAQEENSAANIAATRNTKPATTPATSSSRTFAALAPDAAYTLALYFKRGDNAYRAVRYAEPLWKNIPADYLLELAPREMLELLYPVPYATALLEYAPPRNVDPRFVLAIARQESRFQPEAKSAAAARGLMQFISSTSEAIAAQLGRRDFEQDDLYNPRISIRFGSQYLGNLFKEFPDMPQAVAASYNGGEDNVARWIARARSNDPDRYVIEIGFSQSKDYVFKVMPNYWTYQSLYTEQLRRR